MALKPINQSDLSEKKIRKQTTFFWWSVCCCKTIYWWWLSDESHYFSFLLIFLNLEFWKSNWIAERPFFQLCIRIYSQVYFVSICFMLSEKSLKYKLLVSQTICRIFKTVSIFPDFQPEANLSSTSESEISFPKFFGW